MEFSRYITERAGLLAVIFVVAIAAYGCTTDATPPRHTTTPTSETVQIKEH